MPIHASGVMGPFEKLSELNETLSRVSREIQRPWERLSLLLSYGITPPEEGELDEKTVKWAQAARPHLKDCEGVDQLLRVVASTLGQSRKTGHKWLCKQVPDGLYDTGSYDTEAERFEALRKTVKVICASTESP